MRDVAIYALQLVLLLVISAIPVALAALAISWLLDTISSRFRVQDFWRGPGVFIVLTAWFFLALGFFLAVNWAADWGIPPALE